MYSYNTILGNTIGFRESLEEELKEFTLKIDPIKYFDENDIKEIVLTGKVDPDRFNMMIADNINHYFKFYLPKYIACFGNSQLTHGNIYMGVNDFSEITGIPYFGNLTTSFVESFTEALIPYINDSDIVSKLKFEVIKLNVDKLYIEDNLELIIKDFNEKKTQFEEEYNKNLLERRIWLEKMEFFTVRIYDFANKPEYKKLLIEYIKSSPYFSEEYNHIIELLESSEEIPVGDGAEISQRKLNKHDVIHWITEFKDTTVDKLKSERPVRIPYSSYSDSVYATQFSLLTNMRQRFLNNNDNLHYYLIKIIFPTKSESKLYFRNYGEDNWIIRTRTVVNNAPGCI
jgi:hypothetical protein